MRFLAGLILLVATPSEVTIGGIEFFGYKGIDVASVRQSLPVHVGEIMSNDVKARVRNAVRTTQVSDVCCDENGRTWLYIGLRGASSIAFRYLAKPTGQVRVSPELAQISKERDAALDAAVHKGGESAQEDDSAGYAMSKDPATRALDLRLREYSLHHEDEILNVLDESASDDDRAMAAEALGYAKQSPGQIAALTRACRDSSADVRNNATRALGVLAESSPAIARQIDPATFIDMIRSGIWTDHNKASFVLLGLTQSRDPKLLDALKAQAMDALREMAAWKDTSHAMAAKIILARMAGIPDEQFDAVK
jgi:hypothetical protein